MEFTLSNSSRSVFFIIVIVLLWILFAFFSPFTERYKKQFQKQTISSNLLEYGETGKILKKINAISPVEHYETTTKQQNINEVIKRAKNDRKKWLQLVQYSNFLKKGVFCYMELGDDQEKLQPGKTLLIISHRNGNEWQELKRVTIRSQNSVKAFFLDIDSREFELRFFFKNKERPLTIRSIVFLKKGFTPIAFYDPISYRNFLRKSSFQYDIGTAFFRIFPNVRGGQCRVPFSFKSKKISKISNYQKKQGEDGVNLIVNKYNPTLKGLIFSDEELREMSVKSIPILSVDVPQKSLYSKEIGILKNPAQHGRKWERIAYIRYAKEGKFVFNTFAGIRLQGGNIGRLKGLINFRLYFRKKYGLSSVKSSVFFSGTEGIIKRVAVKQSEWVDWPLNSPIGYDITRRLGGLAPHTSPVLLFLNGKNLGLYYLVPHLGEKQIEVDFSNKDMKYFRWRGRVHPADSAFITNDFWVRLRALEEDGDLNEDSVRNYFDLDRLIANVFAVVFAGTGDFVQGVILKENKKGSKMFWYQWDMDHSFLDLAADIKGKKTNIKRWQKPPHISYLFHNKDRFPRIRILQALMEYDPDFKEKILRKMLFMLNYRLTDEYFKSLLDYYSTVLDRVEYPRRDVYIERLAEYLTKRKDFLAEQIKELQLIPALKKCTIIAEESSFTVNGFLQKNKYTGYHANDEVITIVMQNLPVAKKMFVNGKAMVGARFSFPVVEKQNCQIQINIKD